MKVLILAGGRGTRLWPLSRRYKPKQFQKLLGERTMLQETVNRLLPLFSIEDIYVATNKEYLKEVKLELPNLPRENIILEPVNRERVAAILLFLVYLKDFSKPILILPSDHQIKDVEEFQRAILAGGNFIERNPDYILLLGEKPNFPDTGLGYIKRGEFLKEIKKMKIYQAPFFKEKPNLKRAKEWLKTKKYLWSTGIYIFFPSLIEDLVREFVPDNYKRYQKIKSAFGKKNFKKILEKEYSEMDNTYLEYSLIENYKKIAVLPTSMNWSDIGTWTVLKNCLSLPNQNFVRGNCIQLDSKNIMVYGTADKLITTIGVKDLIIVVTNDIIFVCHKDSSQKVKELVKKIEGDKKFDYI